jgi:hypothetical protein
MYLINYIKCPHCRAPIDVNLFIVSSRLGPSEVICIKCKETFNSGRKEWPFETTYERLRFFGVAIIEIVLAGIIGGNLIFSAEWNFTGKEGKAPNLPWDDPSLLPYCYASATLALFIFMWKIWSSNLRRQKAGPSSESLLSLNMTFGAQGKFLILMLLPWALSFLRT